MNFSKLKRLQRDEDTVFAVDWIVLTAALVGLAIVIIASIQAGSDGLAANVGTYITTQTIF